LMGAFITIDCWPCAFEWYPGIHFNTATPDYGEPPGPFSSNEWGQQGSRATGNQPMAQDIDWEKWEKNEQQKARAHANQLMRLLNTARQSAHKGNFRKAATYFDRYAKYIYSGRGIYLDLSEVMRQASLKTNRTLLNQYMKAQNLHLDGYWTKAVPIMHSIYANKSAGFLRAHALYALAQMEHDRAKEIKLYERVISEFPDSSRVQPAMLRSAWLRLAVGGDEAGTKHIPGPSNADIYSAKQALLKLIKLYPNSLYRYEAFGWLGRAELLKGRTPEAMYYYLKQMGMAKDREEAMRAIVSMHLTRLRITPNGATRFFQMLTTHPILAVTYLDYRLNHSWVMDSDLSNIAKLAEKIVNTHPKTKLPVVIMVRIAEIQYQMGNYRQSQKWASQAINSKRDSQPLVRTDLAYYVRGASRRKSGNLRGGLADFKKVVRRYPKSYLVNSARENMAIIYEKQGDLNSALDIYLTLNFDMDFAYLLDARMTTAQIKRFLADHPHHPAHKLITYSLGIRYMRDNKLGKAEATLRQLTPAELNKMSAKGEFWDSFDQSRLYHPLATIRDLRRLNKAVKIAKTDNKRAEAMYAITSYYYKKRNLLFYNPSLWRGHRAIVFDMAWNTDTESKLDKTSLHKYMYSHECYVRERKICLEIIRRYPNSPTTPKAMYRAATSSYQLNFFNGWWDTESEKKGFYKQAIRLMRQLHQKYPHHPLAHNAAKYAKLWKEEGAPEHY
ncbi:MAG: tetratricopeptide repeat protein, partial [bacterium]